MRVRHSRLDTLLLDLISFVLVAGFMFLSGIHWSAVGQPVTAEVQASDVRRAEARLVELQGGPPWVPVFVPYLIAEGLQGPMEVALIQVLEQYRLAGVIPQIEGTIGDADVAAVDLVLDPEGWVVPGELRVYLDLRTTLSASASLAALDEILPAWVKALGTPGGSPATEGAGLPLPIDRRPVWLINCFGGHYAGSGEWASENAFGVRPEYRGPEGAAWVASRMRDGYNAGARRFFINRPMGVGAKVLEDGTLTSGGNVPGSGWLPIPAYKRPALSDEIASLVLEEFDEPIDVVYFIGGSTVDPRTAQGENSENAAESFQHDSDGARSLQNLRLQLGGLMSAGATGFGIDYSSPEGRRDLLVKLAAEAAEPPFRLRVIGEAVPNRVIDGRRELDPDYVHSAPWVAMAHYYESRWPSRDVVADEATTELYVWCAGPAWHRKPLEVHREILESYQRRGFIPILGEADLFAEALARYNDDQVAGGDPRSATFHVRGLEAGVAQQGLRQVFNHFGLGGAVEVVAWSGEPGRAELGAVEIMALSPGLVSERFERTSGLVVTMDLRTAPGAVQALQRLVEIGPALADALLGQVEPRAPPVNAAVGSAARELQADFPGMRRAIQIIPSRIDHRIGRGRADAGIEDPDVLATLRSRAAAACRAAIEDYRAENGGGDPWAIYCDELPVTGALNPLSLFWWSVSPQYGPAGLDRDATLAKADAVMGAMGLIQRGFADAIESLDSTSIAVQGTQGGSHHRDQAALDSQIAAASAFADRYTDHGIRSWMIWDYWGIGADSNLQSYVDRSAAHYEANSTALGVQTTRVMRTVKLGPQGRVVLLEDGTPDRWSDEQVEAWWSASPDDDPKGVWENGLPGSEGENMRATAPAVVRVFMRLAG